MVEHPTDGTDGTDGTDELELFCDQAVRLQRASDRPLQRLRMRRGGTVLEARWAVPGSEAGGAPDAGPRAGAAPAEPVPAGDGAAPDTGTPVLAPMLGVFYRSPEPGAATFVEPGDLVQPGQQVAIIEAMKLLNPVEAPCSGRVREVLVDDAAPVEFGQALLVVEPVPVGSG